MESKQNESTGEVIFGRKATQGTWSARQGRYGLPTRVGGAPTPPGTPPCLVASSLLPLHGLQVSRVAFLPKISSVKFQVNWTPFDFPFLQYTETREKTGTGTGL